MVSQYSKSTPVSALFLSGIYFSHRMTYYVIHPLTVTLHILIYSKLK